MPYFNSDNLNSMGHLGSVSSILQETYTPLDTLKALEDSNTLKIITFGMLDIFKVNSSLDFLPNLGIFKNIDIAEGFLDRIPKSMFAGIFKSGKGR